MTQLTLHNREATMAVGKKMAPFLQAGDVIVLKWRSGSWQDHFYQRTGSWSGYFRRDQEPNFYDYS